MCTLRERSDETLLDSEYWPSRTTLISEKRPILKATVLLAAFLEVSHFLPLK